MLYKVVAASVAVSYVYSIPQMMRKESSHLAPEAAVVTEHEVAPVVTSQTVQALHEQVAATTTRKTKLQAFRSLLRKGLAGSLKVQEQDDEPEDSSPGLGADALEGLEDKAKDATSAAEDTEEACARCEKSENQLTGSLGTAIKVHENYEKITYHVDKILGATNAYHEQCKAVDNTALLKMLSGIEKTLMDLELGDEAITIDQEQMTTLTDELNEQMSDAKEKHADMESKKGDSEETCPAGKVTEADEDDEEVTEEEPEEEGAEDDEEVTEESLHDEDAPDAVVKEKTGGKYTSCAQVAAQGLCGSELALMGCAKSCEATKVKALAKNSVTDTIKVSKGKDCAAARNAAPLTAEECKADAQRKGYPFAKISDLPSVPSAQFPHGCSEKQYASTVVAGRRGQQYFYNQDTEVSGRCEGKFPCMCKKGEPTTTKPPKPAAAKRAIGCTEDDLKQAKAKVERVDLKVKDANNARDKACEGIEFDKAAMPMKSAAPIVTEPPKPVDEYDTAGLTGADLCLVSKKIRRTAEVAKMGDEDKRNAMIDGLAELGVAASNKHGRNNKDTAVRKLQGITDTGELIKQCSLPMPGKYYLIGGNQNKYCADEGGDGVKCTRGETGPWEVFTLYHKDNFKYVFKGGKDGKYCADDNDKLLCNRGEAPDGGWEDFSIEPAGDGAWAIKGRRNKYCKDNGNDGMPACANTAVHAWEKFKLTPV